MSTTTFSPNEAAPLDPAGAAMARGDRPSSLMGEGGPGVGGDDGEGGGPRRDFLKLAAGAFAAVGVGAIAWPFITSMNPSADVLANASVEADLAPVAVGQSVTIVWRGKPVFVRHRTPEEIAAARAVPLNELIDPETDQARVSKPEWLIVVGVCTHLGCVPLGQKVTDARGDYGGWFCPCHGSQYDTSARVRHGPAPKNLLVPEYVFTSDTAIRVG